MHEIIFYNKFQGGTCHYIIWIMKSQIDLFYLSFSVIPYNLTVCSSRMSPHNLNCRHTKILTHFFIPISIELVGNPLPSRFFLDVVYRSSPLAMCSTSDSSRAGILGKD